MAFCAQPKPPRRSCDGLVGVTIGVGTPYAELARLSAACFEEHTGLPVVVLGKREFTDSGLAHPAALRLVLFELIPCQRAVYFDADWFCLRSWNPALTPPDHLAACRDFILKNEWPHQQYRFESEEFQLPPRADGSIAPTELRTDYISDVAAFGGITRPAEFWINTGLFVVHRDYHLSWLNTSRALYERGVGHHPMYYEQPAMIRALEELHICPAFLPRSVNVLATRKATWPSSVIGLHVKVKRHPEFIAEILSGRVASTGAVRRYFHGSAS